MTETDLTEAGIELAAQLENLRMHNSARVVFLLLAELEAATAELRRLRGLDSLVMSQAERIADQSELLSRRSCREGT